MTPKVVPIAATLLLAAASPAFADLTAFLGLTTTQSARQVRGIAAGVSLLVVGFEFEYSSTSEEEDAPAPSLRTGMLNVLVQTPIPVAGLQFYGTVGAGMYRERLTDVHQETHVGTNFGGGVKITLAGPLRVRVDYRVFLLRGEPLHSKPGRLYAGLNLAF
jgi:hypothetical protein